MSDPVSIDEVASALGLGHHELVALVGGGGKSTLAQAITSQLPGRRVLTTTTKMGHDQHHGLPVLIDPSDDQIGAIKGAAVAWRRLDGHKAIGVAPETCDRWFGLVDHLIVEADGARRKPFKAPAPYEPLVPAATTTLVSVIGADALGRVILDQCHRPLRVAALAGCRPGDRLEPQRAAAVLTHPNGALRARPAGAEAAVVVTKVAPVNRTLVDALIQALRSVNPDLKVVPVAHVPHNFEPGTR